MLRIVMFGGLAVERDQRVLTSAVCRRRMLALLALAAVSGERGIGRDRLVAYLWPERDTDHARNCLKQAVFAARHHLDKDVLRPLPGGLRLNSAVITTDLWEFEAAHTRGAYEAAVRLYTGRFLEGFHIPGLPEFEEWIEREGFRLAMRCRTSVELLAERAAVQADWSAALKWFRLLTVLEPLSSRAALGLMRALVASGDCTEALEYNRVYRATVQRELDSSPDPAVTAYANWLRTSALGQHDRRRRPRTRFTPAHFGTVSG